MPLTQLNHVTVRTNDLEGTRDFYSEVLGLKDGSRPPLAFPGYWLYCGEQAVVHLVPPSAGIGAGPGRHHREFRPCGIRRRGFRRHARPLEAHGSQLPRERSPRHPLAPAVRPGSQQGDDRAELPGTGLTPRSTARARRTERDPRLRRLDFRNHRPEAAEVRSWRAWDWRSCWSGSYWSPTWRGPNTASGARTGTPGIARPRSLACRDLRVG
jgi:catechol 2,3-dioxygenase-like lactoylglutathione lyase family enzyme